MEEKKPINPQVEEYLKSKYFPDEINDEALKAAQQQAEDKKKNLWLSSLIYGLGSAVAGKGGDSTAFQQAARQKIEEDTVNPLVKQRQAFMQSQKEGMEQQQAAQQQKDIEDARNPNSNLSKVYQSAMKRLDPKGDYSSMSALELQKIQPAIEMRMKADEAQLARRDQQANRDVLRQDKIDVNNDKKSAILRDVEDRRINIEDNLTRLEKMIDEKGTYEVFGSHNADMGRLTDQIATDMAKLMDPNSVARPSEVEMFKKGLVSPTAIGMTNATAKNILNNFRNEINSRAATAYKVRGLEEPGKNNTQVAQAKDNLPLRRRTKDGKIALYDAQTKAFLGYEDSQVAKK